jgi:hypothetical protein
MIDKECVICGKVFQVYPSQISASVTCSKACRNERFKQSHPDRHPPEFGVLWQDVLQGPCPQCGRQFKSRYKKTYCSMDCYTKSPGLVERLNAENCQRRVDRECLQCGALIQTKKYASRRYCSSPCRRKWFAERFDRWIANPQEIALPQCFDEFLTQAELPCLIKGCDWFGQSLGYHVNIVHGIDADEFKKMAGFNKSTGLVVPDLSAKMSAIQSVLSRDRLARGVSSIFSAMEASRVAVAVTGSSLEAGEHRAKAIAVKKANWAGDKFLPCTTCGKDVIQPWAGRKLYCSQKCRSRHYMRAQFSMTCSLCGIAFNGNRQQRNRFDSSLPVACSAACRGRLNITKTRNHIKHRATAESGTEAPCP